VRAVNVRAGDRVATVANAGMYTTTALVAIGAEPVFMDVDLSTRVVSAAQVDQAIAAGVRAVVLTHLYGQAIPDLEEQIQRGEFGALLAWQATARSGLR
jgi:dTDP-4-amino-4,6-dideoxygalactose transaminase